ncbi:unnamed protein product [Auanema sp. JU1783]|nr:unnamed protein product [Auanema sp. JU1783]
MSFDDMKTLPHVIKPFTLFLVILQMIFLFSPSYKDFGWFPMTTTILMLIVSTIVFVFFALDVAIVTRSPYWPLAELIYAGVFAVSSAINTFYFFFNIFTPFNFWFVLGTVSS